MWREQGIAPAEATVWLKAARKLAVGSTRRQARLIAFKYFGGSGWKIAYRLGERS